MLPAIAALLFACGTDMQIEKDSATHRAIGAFASQGPQGRTAPLQSFTDFEWDTVHYVPEGSTWESARARIGGDWAEGRDGRTLEPGPLLVFVQGAHVVHTLAVLPPLHLSSRATTPLGTDAVLRAHSKDPGPYLLMLE